MNSQQTIHDPANLLQSAAAKGMMFLVLLTISLFAYVQPPHPPLRLQRDTLLFQSHLPEPTPTSSASWIVASKGGSRQSGTLRIILPPGFTNQSGANVFIDLLIGPSSLRKPANVLPGTEFTVGIWPAQDQVQYQQPMEIRILINAAQVSFDDLQNMVFMQYISETDSWAELPSQFDQATFELVTYIQHFTPVAKDFPDWGGRTFFVVAYPELTPTAPITSPTVNRNANLRAGPGITYAVVGQAVQDQSIQLTAQSANGRWYKLDSGAWIAAFLVDNAPALPVASVTPPPPTPSPIVSPTP